MCVIRLVMRQIIRHVKSVGVDIRVLLCVGDDVRGCGNETMLMGEGVLYEDC